MPVEIDEAQLAQLRASQTLLERLYGNKDTKRDIERLAKKVNPNAVTTDDLAEPYLQPLKDEIKELREFKSSIENMQKDYAKDTAFGRLREMGVTDAGIEDIKKMMTDKGINDPEVAYSHWDRTRPAEPVAPNGISPSMWNFEGDNADEDNKLLWKNDDAWLDKQAARWSQENARKQ